MNKISAKLRKKREELNLSGKKGFTLIELLVVIGILAILVLLAAPSFLGYTRDANVTTMKADAKVLASTALVYNIENEDNDEVVIKYPVKDTAEDATDAGLTTAIAAQEGVTTPGTLHEVSKEKLGKSIQSLKGEASDYVIAIDGDDEGTVYHKTGITAKDKKETNYGVNTKTVTP